jgi:uncharacterized protein YhbP (UPF0306 family)
MVDEIRDYLRQRHSMVLATQLEGEVRAATVCFALDDDLRLYFFVFRDSVKHRGIVQNPQVAAAIDDGFMVPMRGVEMIGAAEIVAGAERRRGQALLAQRFPDLEGVWDDPRILIVRVIPDRLRFTDWAHGIGHSRETTMSPPGDAP